MSEISKQAMNSLARLHAAGISTDDASTLRRCAMTLHRWHELECGDSNDWNSFSIVRGKVPHENGFIYQDDGKPFLEVHPNNGAPTHYNPIPDRETGARKRIAAILKRYPGFAAYVQTDPRGAALYILRPEDQNGLPVGETDFSSVYTRGVALFK